ncbi:GNAT family N-acetyltransferase [Colwellia sp. RE-S-Sl-9]
MPKQYIYKLNVNTIELKDNDIENKELSFFTISNFLDFFLHLFPLINYFKISNTLFKLFLKTLITRKVIYFTRMGDNIVSDGEVTFGYCNHYTIRKNDCVIGPVNTDPNFQGKGIATYSLKSCIQVLFTKYAIENIFIDTKEDNFAMQKVIAKAGFGDKTGYYERENDLL